MFNIDFSINNENNYKTYKDNKFNSNLELDDTVENAKNILEKKKNKNIIY